MSSGRLCHPAFPLKSALCSDSHLGFHFALLVPFWLGQIYGKTEFLNPGGSVKDRVASKIVEEVSHSWLSEIWRWLCRHVVRRIENSLTMIKTISITHKDHFVNVARRRALEARAADLAPESQLYNLAKQDPQLEKRLDQHVDGFDAVRSASTLPCEEPSITSAARLAVEEFINSLEKGIFACIITGVTGDSDVKNIAFGEEQVNTDMDSAEVQHLT